MAPEADDLLDGLALAPALALAADLARAAGRVLADAQQRPAALGTASKGVRRELVTAADRAAERVVVGGILERYPEHGILAEEGELTAAGAASSASPFCWIVDPLDGTTNFVHGLPVYSVSIGLAHRGDVVLGVVHAPALDATYAAARGLGATRNGVPIRCSATGELADALLATGFAYRRDEPGRDDNTARFRRALLSCRDIRRLGSAALDLCLVAAGSFDGYWELDLSPYDVAAGACIVREAGGLVTDLAGGQEWLFGGSILAANRNLHGTLQAAVGHTRDPSPGHGGPNGVGRC